MIGFSTTSQYNPDFSNNLLSKINKVLSKPDTKLAPEIFKKLTKFQEDITNNSQTQKNIDQDCINHFILITSADKVDTFMIDTFVNKIISRNLSQEYQITISHLKKIHIQIPDETYRATIRNFEKLNNFNEDFSIKPVDKHKIKKELLKLGQIHKPNNVIEAVFSIQEITRNLTKYYKPKT